MLWLSFGKDKNFAVWTVPKQGDFEWIFKTHCNLQFRFSDEIRLRLESAGVLQEFTIANLWEAAKFFVPDENCPFYVEHILYDANRKKK